MGGRLAGSRWSVLLLLILFWGVGPALAAAQEASVGSPAKPSEEAEKASASQSELSAISSDSPDSTFGDQERQRADELAAEVPEPLSMDSLELAGLELTLGRYSQLILRLEDLPTLVPPTSNTRLPASRIALLRDLGKAYASTGHIQEARSVYQHLSRDYDDLVGQARLAGLLERSGDREAADALYYGLIRAYNQRSRLRPDDLIAVGVACRQLGRNNPQLFKDALKAFDQAIARSGNGLSATLARIEEAKLFVEKYDSKQAREALQPVMAAERPGPEALLVAATIEHFDGSPRARELALAALEINPSSVDALVFLATLETEAEDRETAMDYTQQALKVNPGSAEALTLEAGLAFLSEDADEFARVSEQVLRVHTGYSDFWVDLSVLAMRNRLYPEALGFASKAVELDPKSWRGWSEMGLNQLRLGQIDEGRKSLETAFAGDPYNVWNKNTLDLLDRLVEYRLVRTEHFQLVLEPSEADLLAPIVGDLAERAYQSLASRYGFEPKVPIRLEVFPSHEDFSVRTVGLSGLGALGVSFGPVIAIDSPAARRIGDFNWGTTLWHEIAHTFTLGLTKGKIPRWLTEGLSVYEERQGPVGWMDDPTLEFVKAFADKQLLGLRAMNDGFVRPNSPNQIGLSYYQASLVAEYIEKTSGFAKIVAMLHDYAAGLSTEDIVRSRFDLSLEEFDERFWSFLEQRFSSILPTFVASPEKEEGQYSALLAEDEQAEGSVEVAAPIGPTIVETEELRSAARRAAEERPYDYRAQLVYGLELEDLERWEDARGYLEKAKALFPEFAGPGSPFHALAEIALALGEKQEAATELRQLVDINEYDFEAHLQLAGLYEDLEQPADELEVLSRSIYIYPYRPEVYERISELAVLLDDPSSRLAALKSLLALRPSGRPRIYYELASTFSEMGELEEAKRAVLGALELAPSYARAQALLLDLVGREGSQP